MEIKVLASGSAGNCYRIKNKDTTLLLECGIPYKKLQKSLNFKVTDLDACLVTHEHMDHAKSVKKLTKAGIDCYMTVGTAKALKIRTHRIKTFKNDTHVYKKETIGSFEILPFEAVHDVNEPVSYYIRDLNTDERLAFITDTAYVKYRLPNLNYLMIECNYVKSIMDENMKSGHLYASLRNRIVKNHMSLETLLEMIETNNLSRLKRIYLLHLSDGNSDEKYIKDQVQKATGVEVVVC